MGLRCQAPHQPFVQAKEKYFAHTALFKSFLTATSEEDSAFESQFRTTYNRYITSKFETVILKALLATTKTLASQKEAINEAIQDHAKATREEREKHFLKQLLEAADKLLAQKDTGDPKQDAPVAKAKAKKKGSKV